MLIFNLKVFKIQILGQNNKFLKFWISIDHIDYVENLLLRVESHLIDEKSVGLVN